MAYIKIETTARFNRKLVKAGPAAAWLWLCGNCHSQDALTDGFIAEEVIDFLGVPGALALVPALVTAGLWDAVDGGWTIHDYLEHNRSKDEVTALKERRAGGGKLGGQPSHKKPSNLPRTRKVAHMGNLHTPRGSTFPVVVDVAAAVADLGEGDPGEPKPADPATPFAPEHAEPTQPPFAAWLRELQDAYPPKARTGGYLTESAFIGVFQRHPEADPCDLMAQLRQGLISQREGGQWRRGMVPKLHRWFAEDIWQQRHEAVEVSEVVSPKTQRTAASAAAFLQGSVG